ncbi:MAG: Fe-S-binding domain-containing protein, partial [bacterium]|nr:Fe-S-binding domain-containing protein [bacterium]
MSDHLLSIVMFTPLAGMLILLLLPASNTRLIRLWANIAAFAGFLVSLTLLLRFDKSIAGFQMVEKVDWIPWLGVQYYIGIDGISLLLIMLTTLTGFLAILSSWSAIDTHVKAYYAMFLLQQTAM